MNSCLQRPSAWLFGSFLAFNCLAFNCLAAETAAPAVTNLDQLLAKVRSELDQERKLNEQREAEFVREKNRQQQLLDKARASLYSAQSKNSPARAQAEANEQEIARLRKELQKNVSDMGDIYTIHNQFAMDFKTVLEESQVGAQFPARAKTLADIHQADALPSIEDMEKLWLLTLEEMNESGKVVQYPGKIVNAAGDSRQATITRLGNFSAFSEDEFLRYVPETSEFIAPHKQPESRLRSLAEDFADADAGEVEAAPLDPTRGNLLGMVARTPTLLERIQQGGSVGYLTIAVGLAGLLLTLYRILFLLKEKRAFTQQLQQLQNPRVDNALGRVLLSARNSPIKDEETIQYVLDEAVLKEIPKLEQGHSVIKLFAAIGPMLGLLGTVTGMIKTFEAISLFGGGDPKLMAAGISEALVCTVLGLLVAVPMLLSHNLVTSFAKELIQRLDEQSAAILARLFETQKTSDPKTTGVKK